MQGIGRRDTGSKPGEAVLSCSFNQDRSCLAVATRRGFKIYSCDTGTCVYDDSMGAVRIVEMLFCTSLLVVVGAGDTPELSPRRLKVLNTSNHTCIADLTFVSSVLAVRLNRARLVVVEERRAVVHDLSTLCVQRTIDTVPNPRGVCALSSDEDSSLLALPAHTHHGAVVVHDCVNLHVVCELRCHNSPVAACALTRDGAMLATASAKGTVIRVHCLPHGTKLWSFRRGVVNAKVRCLCFGAESGNDTAGDDPEPGAKLLAASSEKGTVHVWRIEGPPRDKDDESYVDEVRASNNNNADEGGLEPGTANRSSLIGAALKGGGRVVGAMLPSGLRRRVSDAVQPTRDAVTVHLPRPANDGSYLDRAIGGVATVASVVSSQALHPNGASSRADLPGIAGVCALRDGSAPGEVRVVAVNADGLLCEYSADYATGQKVALERECSIDDYDGGGFPTDLGAGGGDGSGTGGGAAVPGGARWLGGGDVGAPGGGRAADLSASVSMSMGQSLFMAHPMG